MGSITAISRPLDVRTVFVSDLHLGFSGRAADQLLTFLRAVRCRNLNLVGDVIDFWALAKHRRWPAAHSDVVEAILAKARGGTTGVSN